MPSGPAATGPASARSAQQAAAGHATPQGTPRKLTPEQIGRVLIAEGWPKSPQPVAKGIAIVEAESGGDWDSTSDNPSGGKNRGGWQIDSASHPDVDDNCARSPSCSSRWVWKTTHGTNYSQWATAGADPGPFLAAARSAIAAGPLHWADDTGGILGGKIELPDALAQVAQVLEAIAKFFVGLGELLLTPEGWLRVGKLGAGALLIAAGTSHLAKLSLGIDPIGTAAHAAVGAGAGFLAAGPGGAAVGALASGALGKPVAGATSRLSGAASGG